MARPKITDIRELGDISVVFRWDMDIKAPKALAAAPAAGALNFRCNSTELPKMTGQNINVEIRGHRVKHAGIYQYTDTIVLEFTETVDNTIAKFLREWRELCWKTKEGTSQLKKDLEATVILTRLNNQNSPIWRYTLYGAFIDSFDYPNLDGNTSDAWKPTITLCYDYFEDESLSSGSAGATTSQPSTVA